MAVRTCVLYGFGINCDYETQYAFEAAGAAAERVHVNDFVWSEKGLADYHVLAFPGGFSFGDDLGSGKVLANKFKFNLKEQLQQFIDGGKLVIGICNGFQSLVKLGVLPALGGDYFSQTTTLTFNDSGRFEDRWVWLRFNHHSKCVWTKKIPGLYLPVRHGEGKFVAGGEEVMKKMKQSQQIVAQYVDEQGQLAGYPYNPNGSQENVAAICDESGRVYGMMPHPEALNHFTNHPRWTRGEGNGNGGKGAGLQVFENAVAYAQEKLV